jgi:hypothetical protein
VNPIFRLLDGYLTCAAKGGRGFNRGPMGGIWAG